MNKRAVASILSVVMTVGLCLAPMPDVHAETSETTKNISNKVYEFGEDDDYKLSGGSASAYSVQRFSISGKISDVSTKNGVDSYAVDVEEDDNLTIQTKFVGLPESMSSDGWEVVEDSDKEIDTIDLDGKIKDGAYVIQTSRNGKIWVTDVDETLTDYFDSDVKQGDAVYKTNNVQLTSGCYYRIIVAYEIKKQVGSSNILFHQKKEYEYKKIAEVYTFYAYNKKVDDEIKKQLMQKQKTADPCVMGDIDDLVRCKESEGYYGSQVIDADDPHKGWEIGKFYVSGYTAKTETTEGTPVILKEVGDRVSLWFNLEQDLNACNGNSKIKVVADPEGTDSQFNDVTIQDFGKGMLFIRKTDYLGNTTTYPYKNFLEASATPGANTRLDLFEEGDYEVALDYALKYNNTTVLGASVLPKILHYRVSFKFSVRNGDCKLFIRDAKTKMNFINNSNVAENGFYIDLANQRYLDLQLTREVMSDSLDGLVADTKFNGAALEGRMYTDEGVYTIKATNRYTSATTEKKIYVGNTDVLKAHVVTGLSVAEINERLAAGAYIDNDGNIITPTAQQEIVEAIKETDTQENNEDYEVNDVVESEAIDNVEEVSEQQTQSVSNSNKTGIIVFIVIAGIVVIWVGKIVLKNRGLKKQQQIEEDDEPVVGDENKEEQDQ